MLQKLVLTNTKTKDDQIVIFSFSARNNKDF